MLLGLLERTPGNDLQSRWHVVAAQWDAGEPAFEKSDQASGFQLAALALFNLETVRPSYGSLHLHFQHLASAHWEEWHPSDFHRLQQAIRERGLKAKSAATGLKVLARICLVTGRSLTQLSADDLVTYGRATTVLSGAAAGLIAAANLLEALGISPGPAFSTVWSRRQGVLTPEELVDREQVQTPAVRNLLVRYLEFKAITIKQVSLKGLALVLVKHFWRDIERHHPEVESLDLSPQLAEAWRRRHARQATRNRETTQKELMLIRALYLDLQELAQVEPEAWPLHRHPPPVRAADLHGMTQRKRERVARMQERTRRTTPLLEAFLSTLWPAWQRARTLLDLAASTPPGLPFTHEGIWYEKLAPPKDAAVAVLAHVVPAVRIRVLGDEKILNCTFLEEDTFWVWVVAQFLRDTGVRVSELIEITALSMYELHTVSGEQAVVLQIAATNAKNGCERQIPMAPSLVHVAALARQRITRPDGQVPLTSYYNPQSGAASPPLPYLFQRRSDLGTSFTVSYVRRLLLHAAERAGLTNERGQLYCPTPHDFRRTFASEAVRQDLPVHILANLMGHSDLNTTMRYVATYSDDVVRHFLAHQARRRALRPPSEYREPTHQELEQFSEHFGKRLVALGTCHRPYQTPCIHEHACIRCTMLAVDPAQLLQLQVLERDLETQLVMAKERQWDGESEGLSTTLDHLRRKKTQAEERLLSGD